MLNSLPGATPDFDLTPSASTAERMRRLNWMFKSLPEGGMVFAEKIISPDGQSTFARQPITDEPFTFLIRLNNPALLNYTVPFAKKAGTAAAPSGNIGARGGAAAEASPVPTVVPNNGLPSFSGRGRLLYFDNLLAVPIPQPNTPPGEPPLLRMTAGDFVGLPELASRGPTPFNFAPIKGSTAIEFTPLVPTSTPVVILDIPAQSQSFVAKVPDNAYRMKQLPGDQSELIFLTGEPLDSSVFGIVRIFNLAALPVLDQNRRYTVVFAEA
jgi:hypothetical protein